MKPLRLIIVEDSEDDSLLLLLELQRGGYKPDHIRVETAEELSISLQKKSWDLILSDHSLPSFSAPEALKVLNNSGIDLPFIIVSSTIGEEVAVEAMKAGAHDYISKSNLARLIPVVERALNDADARRERRRAEEALKESEARFRRLLENAPDLIYRVRLVPKLEIEFLSPSVEEFIGYPQEYFYDDPASGFGRIHPDDQALVKSLLNGELSFTSPLLIRWIHRDASIVWSEHRNVPLYSPEGNLVVIEGIARDITKRILSEQQLKTSHAQIEALSKRILGALEEERARLARELHDELGQALTAVKLDLQLLGDFLQPDKKLQDTLKQSIELVDYTIGLVRCQSVSLRPPVLDDMGLLPALENMVSGFMNRTGVRLEIDASCISKRLPGHVETALYRCIQESLTNIARHAEAENAMICIEEANEDFLISITDDGIGFDPDKLSISSEHIGLTGMQERVKLLDGKFKIESTPGEGTRIAISVPCHNEFERNG